MSTFRILVLMATIFGFSLTAHSSTCDTEMVEKRLLEFSDAFYDFNEAYLLYSDNHWQLESAIYKVKVSLEKLQILVFDNNAGCSEWVAQFDHVETCYSNLRYWAEQFFAVHFDDREQALQKYRDLDQAFPKLALELGPNLEN